MRLANKSAAPAILLGTGAVFIGALAVLRMFAIPVLPSLLAAWLFVLSFPAGALPLLFGLELSGHGDGPHAFFLRRILVSLPLGLLLVLPILFGVGSLFHWARTPHGRGWLTPVFFDMRSVIYLAVWACLAVLVRRPPPGAPRAATCVLGLIAYVMTATLAADDWIGSAEPGPDLASLGLLLITSQAVIAAAAARLLGAPPSPMMALIGVAWGVVDFTRFLTTWSADKPDEIVYYQHRETIFGQGVVWLSLAVVVLSLMTLIPGPLKKLSGAAAGLVLLAHAADMLWMVTPADRGLFVFTTPDLLAMLGVTALGAGLLAWRPAARQTA
jgi:hypothetical protein